MMIKDKRGNEMKKHNKNFNTFQEAQKVLGEDFWDVLSDAYPLIGPRADILQSKEEMVVIMDIPGIRTQQDIKISLQDPYLVIQGEIPNIEVPHYEYLQQERFYGSFRKKIKMPSNAIYQQLKASYRYGILQINIPTSGRTSSDDVTVPIEFFNE